MSKKIKESFCPIPFLISFTFFDQTKKNQKKVEKSLAISFYFYINTSATLKRRIFITVCIAKYSWRYLTQ